MTKPDTKPRDLVVRVRKFFADRPDEELTYASVQAKFSCTYRSARYAVETLAEEGLLEKAHVIRLRSKGVAREETA